mgnify:CR=1 FL=1
MDLSYTAKQQAFRTEARSWLEENAPSEPLRSFDTPEGFEEHREWEKKLHTGGFAMVPWPTEYGGRGADLLEWLIFEDNLIANLPISRSDSGCCTVLIHINR